MYTNDVIIRKLAMETYKDRIKWITFGGFGMFYHRIKIGDKSYIRIDVNTTFNKMEIEIHKITSHSNTSRKFLHDSEIGILRKAFESRGMLKK